MTFTYKDVAEIIKIIDASNCDEMIVELAELKIVVRRGGDGMRAPRTIDAPVNVVQKQTVPMPTERKSGSQENQPNSIPLASGGRIIRSPMTGTFYRAASPKDPPYVENGSMVKKGDTICTIEVMKLFTTITTDMDGVISRIFPVNAELVQFDQPLFVIEERP